MEESHKFCPKCSEKRPVIGPDILMLELGDDFFQDSTSSDWSERKEALEKLLKILQSYRLEDGDYQRLVSHLRKIIISDLCVIVVGLAVQCVTGLAKRLGKDFSRYAGGMSHVLFEKFMEKRQKMTELLRESVDTIFETTKLEYLRHTIIRLLKHNNPSIRYEMILFLTRSFPKCSKAVLTKPLMRPLFLSLKDLLSDIDVLIREKTLAALGAAMQVAGEKVIMPYIKDLDLASKAKLEVYQMRAWEIAKTYNEMKFPNFRERLIKPKECPDVALTSSQVSISSKKDSKLDVKGSASDRTVNNVPPSHWASEIDKESNEAANIADQKHESDQLTNMSMISEDSNTRLMDTKEVRKQPSLSPGFRLDEEESTHIVQIPMLKHGSIESDSISDIEEVPWDPSTKPHSKTDWLLDSTDEIMIRQFTDQCLADVAQRLKELAKEHRLIAYRQSTTGTINEFPHRATKTTKTVGTVTAEPGDAKEESQVGFTKRELDGLLNILNAARTRTKDNVKPKKKSHSNKENRFTTMSKGFLYPADHKEIQCTTTVGFVEKPTQTLCYHKETPRSISCILNCCDKCTRLLMSRTQPLSKYLFPINTKYNNPPLQGNESSDNTLYRELAMSGQLHAKSESDLTKNILQNDLVRNERETNRSPKISRSYEVNNLFAFNKRDPQFRSKKFQSQLKRRGFAERPVVNSKGQQTEPESKFTFQSQDKNSSSKRVKVSTCNKTTFVTTTSQRRKAKRKKNRSTFNSADDVPEEDLKVWLQSQFQSKGESKRAMKVRVIRIE